MRVAWIGLFLMAFASCSSPPRSASPRALPDTGQPALHAIQDARLRTLMQQMNSLMFDNLRTEPDIDRDRRQHARQIAESAAALATALDGIVANRSRLKLSPSEEDTFVALANKLRKLTQTLEQDALNNHIDALPKTLEQMTLTCSSCHQLFRDMQR